MHILKQAFSCNISWCSKNADRRKIYVINFF